MILLSKIAIIPLDRVLALKISRKNRFSKALPMMEACFQLGEVVTTGAATISCLRNMRRTKVNLISSIWEKNKSKNKSTNMKKNNTKNKPRYFSGNKKKQDHHKKEKHRKIYHKFKKKDLISLRSPMKNKK